MWFDSTVEPGTPIRVDLYLVDDCGGVSMGTQEVASVASTSVLRNGPSGAFPEALPRGDYGFYGVAKDDRCAVVAAGCAPVSVTSEQETLSLVLDAHGRRSSVPRNSVIATPVPVALAAPVATAEWVAVEALAVSGGTGGSAGTAGTGGGSGTGGQGGTGGMPSDRVTDGLIVLYDFDEGSGSTVIDRSGVAPVLDLTIEDPGNVTWSGDHLTIDAGTTLRTAGEATKVFSRVVPKNQLTVEAWVRPATLVGVGTPPDRILTMSPSSSQRNFLLGQDEGQYAARFRTEGENNGNPTVYTSPASASTALTHVVFTHDSDGNEVLYVDGTADMTATRVGDTATWDSSFPLIVANEASGGREWLGELHLIAIYDRALSPVEVGRNFTAGP